MAEKKLLQHLGIIMDGNRRWAKEKGLPSLEGHRRGYEVIKTLRRHCLEKGIKTVTLYAFSRENWNRTEAEVSYLMDLLCLFLKKDVAELDQDGIKVRVIGGRDRLNSEILTAIQAAEEKTAGNTRGLLQLAINYTGRHEIIEAVKKMVSASLSAEDICEEELTKNLYTAGVSDPDLIIRTSGEQRLSGFLLWQGAYSEILFVKKYWPDFNEKDLDEAISWYESRDRRFGK